MVDADNGIGEAGWRVVGGLRRFGSIMSPCCSVKTRLAKVLIESLGLLAPEPLRQGLGCLLRIQSQQLISAPGAGGELDVAHTARIDLGAQNPEQ